MTSQLQNASALHAQGKKHFIAGFHPEAELYYRAAIESALYENEDATILKFDLANACQMIRRFDEASAIYQQFVNEPGHIGVFARGELAKLQERKRQWMVPVNAQSLTADDERFLKIASPMLSQYPALVRPVHITWVEDSKKSLLRLQEIQKEQGDPQESWLKSLSGWEALGYIIGSSHWILVKSDWRKANDSELRGLLSHELAHEELKDTFKGQFIDPMQSQLGFICNERATDLLAVSKGYGVDLLQSRKFLEKIRGSLDRSSALTTPKELARLLQEQH